MKMTQEQSKLVELTMRLNLLAKEYNKLCKDLDKLKKLNISPNSEVYVKLLKKFEDNNKQVQIVVEQLKALK